MTTIANPTDNMFLSDLTGVVENIPNTYGLITNMNLFNANPISQTSFILDLREFDIRLQDSVDRDSHDATTIDSDVVKQIGMVMPYFKSVESLTPMELQGVRQVGTASQPEQEAAVKARKLMKLRMQHAITKEFLMAQALKGKILNPQGQLIADLNAAFGVQKKTFYFDLDNPAADIDGTIEALKEHMEKEALTGALIDGERIKVLVDSVFFRKLINHPKIREAYLAQQSATAYRYMTGSLRTGVSDGTAARTSEFVYGGLTFVKYTGAFKDMRGKNHKLVGITGVDDNIGVGHAFPDTSMLGAAADLYQIAYGPCPKMGYANTLGKELYAFEYLRPRDEGVDFEMHSYMLPYCTRPQLLVDVRADKQ